MARKPTVICTPRKRTKILNTPQLELPWEKYHISSRIPKAQSQRAQYRPQTPQLALPFPVGSSTKSYYVAGDRVWWYVTDAFDDDDGNHCAAWRPGTPCSRPEGQGHSSVCEIPRGTRIHRPGLLRPHPNVPLEGLSGRFSEWYVLMPGDLGYVAVHAALRFFIVQSRPAISVSGHEPKDDGLAIPIFCGEVLS